MAKLWFTSDWHLGDTRLDRLGRVCFRDEISAYLKMLENHNSVVQDGDTVFVLGDVLWSHANPDVWLKRIGHFKGEKYLVRGNHDRPFTDDQFSDYFHQIVGEGDGTGTTISGETYHLPLWLTHYPSSSKVNQFNLVGHIHSAWRVQLNMLNVGVDANHFFPVSHERVLGAYEAVMHYYDRDVWVGDHEANVPYKALRGKQTSYLDLLEKTST